MIIFPVKLQIIHVISQSETLYLKLMVNNVTSLIIALLALNPVSWSNYHHFFLFPGER